MKKNEPELLNDIYFKMSEHSHQVELFAWAAMVNVYGLTVSNMWVNQHPLHAKRKPPRTFCPELIDPPTGDKRLMWMHSIPNGGSRGSTKLDAAIVGARMRAEGVKRGVPDVFLPWPSPSTSGFYLELKRANKSVSRLSKEQVLFKEYCGQVGYRFAVCYGYLAAINEICSYLNECDLELTAVENGTFRS